MHVQSASECLGSYWLGLAPPARAQLKSLSFNVKGYRFGMCGRGKAFLCPYPAMVARDKPPANVATEVSKADYTRTMESREAE